VDKVLETVVNNLEVTNNLDIQPENPLRVILTSTLESFTIGHTIVFSRGLVDVLPDEASLAAMVAHEVSHVVLDTGSTANMPSSIACCSTRKTRSSTWLLAHAVRGGSGQTPRRTSCSRTRLTGQLATAKLFLNACRLGRRTSRT